MKASKNPNSVRGEGENSSKQLALTLMYNGLAANKSPSLLRGGDFFTEEPYSSLLCQMLDTGTGLPHHSHLAQGVAGSARSHWLRRWLTKAASGQRHSSTPLHLSAFPHLKQQRTKHPRFVFKESSPSAASPRLSPEPLPDGPCAEPS